MARKVAAAREIFLVEHYRPGLGVEELEQLAAGVQDVMDDLEREGRAIRLLHSTIVPTDESVLFVVEAGSKELVREAHARAGFPFERISTAIDQGGRP